MQTNPDQQKRLKQFITEEARAAGFDVVAITSPDAIPQARERLREYLALGRHASMEWMQETEERRGRPQALWPEVRSIIVLAMNYGPDSDPLAVLQHRDKAAISVYAQNRDYHDIVKGKLKGVASRFASRAAGEDLKVFVDTAPVMEKPLAEASGLGWQGKHTNLVSRTHGSWLFLGTIFTTAALPCDSREPDHCGSCRACLDACPTAAFPAPYQLDARRCISYLTIEHKGPIAPEFRKAMGNRIYGCDDCLAVCPWNKFAETAREAKLRARDDLRSPALADLLTLDDPAFRALFSGSPIKRIGRDRFLRNVLNACGNSDDSTLTGPVKQHLTDPSPLVRGAAVWALSQLAGHRDFAASRLVHAAKENDAGVLTEWRNGAKKSAMKIFLFGAGYSARAYARLMGSKTGFIGGTTRDSLKLAQLDSEGITPFLFHGTHASQEIADALETVTHLVVSTSPASTGDPVIALFGDIIRHAMPRLQWIGYLSTVGVYGNHAGAWVDETTLCSPVSSRSVERANAEQGWQELADARGVPLAILRLSGIYGPGRNAFVNLTNGTARRLNKTGQVFNRIHVDDIAGALQFLSLRNEGGIFNITDDEPAPPQDVVAYAAELMGVEPPEEADFETAQLTPMARSFYGENKRVSNGRIKSLGFSFRYPDYGTAFAAMWRDGSWR